MSDVILVCNAGSSSLKISIFSINNNLIDLPLYHILIEKENDVVTFHLTENNITKIIATKQITADPIDEMIEIFFVWWQSQSNMNLVATGHRIVHGGNIFSEPLIVTAEIIKQIESLIPLDPLHQPYNLAALNLFAKKYSNKPHIACFDTAFHATQSKLAKSFALPKKFADMGISKYGFHGLSYQFVSQNFKALSGTELPPKTIIAHLGSGSSMCALKNGISVASSMGFSVLEGLMMGTRCGSIDPGVILYLLENNTMTVKEVSNLLYKNSGLLGVSGESADIRTLLHSNSENAKFAVELFIYKIQQEIGKLASVLQGIDAIIFTAGIGQHSSLIREMICSKLSWLGCRLDKSLNEKHNISISAADSSVKIFVIATDEEKIIATNVALLICCGNYP